MYAADIRANYFYGYSASPLLVNETGPGLVTGGDSNNHNSKGAISVLQVQAGTKWNRPLFGSRVTIGDGAGASALLLNGAAGSNRQAAIQTAGVSRWMINWANSVAESGANAGSNLEYLAYSDTGAYLGPALTLYRATRQTRIHNEVRIDGAINHDGTTVGFYGATPVKKPTGVAVTPQAIHAALVKLGLISG